MPAMPRTPTCQCGECRKCKHRAYMKFRYDVMTTEERREMVAKRDKEKIRARDRARSKTAARRQHNKENTARWRQQNPEKARAQNLVAKAVRSGKLVKEPCLFCDDPDTHAHHHDYTRPLDVTWLCARHHKLAHR